MKNATISQSNSPLLQILTSINATLSATINQLTSGWHKSIPRKHLPQARGLEMATIKATQNATIHQLTSGGHKSIPRGASSAGPGSKS
jgi:hypothetical protein